MKLIAIALIGMMSFAAHAANTLDADGVLRDADGNVVHMNYADALQACPNGTHLPTAREMAKLGQASGALGIWQSNFNQGDTPPAGYVLIRSTDSAGQNMDNFFYNKQGYNVPDTDVWTNWFWSASLVADDATSAYGMFGFNGNLDSWYASDDSNSVRCVINPLP